MHQEWIQTVMWSVLAATAVFHTSINRFMKQKLSNDITVYGVSDVFTQIKTLINDYTIWKDHGNAVDIPEKEWMDISLLNN